MAKYQIKIVIEKTKSRYTSYAENVPGINGSGSSAEEAIQSALNMIEILKKVKSTQAPLIIKKKYSISYLFDASSMLNYYSKIFTNAALERMTGIHQKQIQHYTSGLKKPRSAQAKKFEDAFRQLGNELTTIKLRST